MNMLVILIALDPFRTILQSHMAYKITYLTKSYSLQRPMAYKLTWPTKSHILQSHMAYKVT